MSYADHHEGLHQRAGHYEATIWGLTMDRVRLYALIDARVDRMLSFSGWRRIRPFSR